MLGVLNTVKTACKSPHPTASSVLVIQKENQLWTFQLGSDHASLVSKMYNFGPFNYIGSDHVWLAKCTRSLLILPQS